MTVKFIIRFDDLSPYLDLNSFLHIKSNLDEHGIKSVLGVIPLCKDPKLVSNKTVDNFFELMRVYRSNGDAIAQHGYTHVYDTANSGLLKINNRSEFAGHSYEIQCERILKGKNILLSEGIWQPYFMAPAHSFDLTTLDALADNGFTALTDGYGVHPYRNKLLHIPQLFSSSFNFGFGTYTICLHINNMPSNKIIELNNFIKINRNLFVDFKEIANYCELDFPCSKPLRLFTEYSLRLIRLLK